MKSSNSQAAGLATLKFIRGYFGGGLMQESARTLMRAAFLFSLAFFAIGGGLAFAQTDSPTANGVTANGFPENGVFEGSAFDSVQMNNGNLHLQIRFACVPGRGHTFCYVYSYDNRGWYYRSTILQNGGTIVNPWPELLNAMQWRLPLDAANFSVRRSVITLTQCGSGTYGSDGCSKNPEVPPGPIVCGTYGSLPVYGTIYSNYVLFEPDGTKHGFWESQLGPYGPHCQTPNDSSRLYATDGSGWVIDQNNGIVSRAISKDGTQITFQDDSSAVWLSPNSVTDRNGNDLLGADGRLFPFFTVTDPNTGASTFTYYDSGGAARNINLTFVSVPVLTQLCQFSVDFGCRNEYQYSFSQPSIIQLPNGQTYQFTYEQSQYGEPNSVTLPTGAKISWAWGSLDQGGRRVSSRTVTVNGQTSTWNYFWGTIVGGGAWQNSMVDPNGDETVYTCQDIPSGFPGEDGDPSCTIVKVQYYQGRAATGTLLKTVATDYCAASISSGNCSTPLPIRETTTLNNSNLVSKIETDWDSILLSLPANIYATQRDPIERREYDWGNGAPGSLLRRTHYNYLHLTNQNYKNSNLADFPTNIVTYDGAGNVVAQTTNSYDGSQLAATSGASNHDYTNFGISNTVRANLTQTGRWRNTDNVWLNTNRGYDDLGNLRSTTDPNGNATIYSYGDNWANTSCVPSGANIQAYVTQITNALGQKTQTTYFPCTGLKQAVQDQNDINANRAGNTFAYDLMNRPLTLTYVDGGQTSFCYSETSGASCSNNGSPLEVVTTKKITSGSNLVTTAVEDGLGRTIQTRLADPEGDDYVDTTYDALGRVSTVSNPHRTGSSSTDGITTTSYDALGRVTQTTKQDGSISLVKYDLQTGNANCTLATDETGKPRYACSDALGRLVEVQEPSAASVFTPGWSRVLQQWGMPGDIPVPGDYDGDGITDFAIWRPSTATWWVMRSSDGMMVTQQWGNQASGDIPVPGDYDGDGKTDFAIWRPGTGVWWILRSSDGGTTTQQWGNQASGDIPVPGDYDGDHKTDFAIWRPTTGTWWVMRSSDGGTTTQQWGNQASGDIPVPGDYDGDHKTDFAVWRPTTGTWWVMRSSDGGTTTQQWGLSGDKPAQGDYDGDGKTDFAVWRPSTATWWLVRSSDGHQVSEQWGTNGDMPIAASFQGGGQADFAVWNPTTGIWSVSLSYVTLYSYDALGNLISVNQQGDGSQAARVRTFTYDSLSRLVTANNPESGTISYSYDANGNVLQKTSPAPNQTQSTVTQTISYCYDKLNRVTGKQYAATSCPLSSPVVSYSYDAGTNGIGHLTSLADQAGSGSYSYDALGQISSEQRTIAGIQKSLSYTYFLDSSINTLTYPSGAVVTYTPDAAGRVLSAVDNSNNVQYVTSATYAPDSSLTGFVSGHSSTFNGITNNFTYNQRLQPITMSATTPSNQTLFSLSYDFHLGNGDNGNVYAIANNRDSSRSQTFTYDALNRLTSAQNGGTDCTKATVNGKTEYWGNSYAYDPWGNLKTKIPTKCSAESLNEVAYATNQLHTISGADNAYDAAGNMTHDATLNLNYVFDPENRITGGGGYTYTYDDEGNRVEKSNGSTGTIYWYLSPGIVAESDLGGNLQSEYVFFDGERVARKDLPGNAVSYYFSDHLKTASVITDSAGNIKEDEDYYPWGGELQFVNSDPNHYKFTGKERDAETGLDYFGARYYGNWLGRFVTADWAARPETVPYADLDDPQSLNLYSYVRNIPTVKVDTDGHDTTLEEEVAQKVVDLIVRPLIETAYAGVKTGVRFTFGTAVGVLGVVFTSTPAGSADEDRIMREINAKAQQQQQQKLGQGRGADEEKSQSDIARDRARTNGGIVTDAVHRNSLSTNASAEGYSLRDRDTGEILKYGETTLGKARYTKEFLKQHNADMVFEAKGTKREMHKWQHNKILEYKAQHNGHRPPLNKSDY